MKTFTYMARWRCRNAYFCILKYQKQMYKIDVYLQENEKINYSMYLIIFGFLLLLFASSILKSSKKNKKKKRKK